MQLCNLNTKLSHRLSKAGGLLTEALEEGGTMDK